MGFRKDFPCICGFPPVNGIPPAWPTFVPRQMPIAFKKPRSS